MNQAALTAASTVAAAGNPHHQQHSAAGSPTSPMSSRTPTPSGEPLAGPGLLHPAAQSAAQRFSAAGFGRAPPMRQECGTSAI